MQLTQQEILFIKELYADKILCEQSFVLNKQIDDAIKLIAEKYQPLLDQAEQDNDIELRKQLIEQQTLEAKAKEEEIRNI